MKVCAPRPAAASLSLTLSSAFLLRSAVEAASRVSTVCCELSFLSTTPDLALITVLSNLPPSLSLWSPIGHSAPPPSSYLASNTTSSSTTNIVFNVFVFYIESCFDLVEDHVHVALLSMSQYPADYVNLLQNLAQQSRVLARRLGL